VVDRQIALNLTLLLSGLLSLHACTHLQIIPLPCTYAGTSVVTTNVVNLENAGMPDCLVTLCPRLIFTAVALLVVHMHLRCPLCLADTWTWR
jgi:hypothetical protein